MIGLAIQNIKRGAALWAIAGLLLSAPASAAIYKIETEYIFDKNVESVLTIDTERGVAIWKDQDPATGYMDLRIESENIKGFGGFEHLKAGQRIEIDGLAAANITGTSGLNAGTFYLNGTKVVQEGKAKLIFYRNFDDRRGEPENFFRVAFGSSYVGGISISSDHKMISPSPTPIQPPTTSVPEPGALGLMGLGLFALALSRRRRRKPVFAAA